LLLDFCGTLIGWLAGGNLGACLVGGLGRIRGCLGLWGFVGCFELVFGFEGVFPLWFVYLSCF
jgi:hypothetical protein